MFIDLSKCQKGYNPSLAGFGKRSMINEHRTKLYESQNVNANLKTVTCMINGSHTMPRKFWKRHPNDMMSCMKKFDDVTL